MKRLIALCFLGMMTACGAQGVKPSDHRQPNQVGDVGTLASNNQYQFKSEQEKICNQVFKRGTNSCVAIDT